MTKATSIRDCTSHVAVCKGIKRSYAPTINTHYSAPHQDSLLLINCRNPAKTGHNYHSKRQHRDLAKLRCGVTLAKSGSIKGARIYYQKALKLKPNSEEAQKALDKLSGRDSDFQ